MRITLLGDLGLYEETLLTNRAAQGFYCLMTCVNDALRFEIDCRDELEARKNLDELQARQGLRREFEEGQAEAGDNCDDMGEDTDP